MIYTILIGYYWEIREIYFKAVGFVLPDFVAGFNAAHFGDGYGII